MEIKHRKTIYEDLKKFSPVYKNDDYIEITEWYNGEGWDININGQKQISLHYDELDAINYLIQQLRYEK